MPTIYEVNSTPAGRIAFAFISTFQAVLDEFGAEVDQFSRERVERRIAKIVAAAGDVDPKDPVITFSLYQDIEIFVTDVDGSRARITGRVEVEVEGYRHTGDRFKETREDGSKWERTKCTTQIGTGGFTCTAKYAGLYASYVTRLAKILSAAEDNPDFVQIVCVATPEDVAEEKAQQAKREEERVILHRRERIAGSARSIAKVIGYGRTRSLRLDQLLAVHNVDHIADVWKLNDVTYRVLPEQGVIVMVRDEKPSRW